MQALFRHAKAQMGLAQAAGIAQDDAVVLLREALKVSRARDSVQGVRPHPRFGHRTLRYRQPRNRRQDAFDDGRIIPWYLQLRSPPQQALDHWG
jgi:hypothetical protein